MSESGTSLESEREKDTLQHTATHCNTLQHTATHCNIKLNPVTFKLRVRERHTHCSTLQHQRHTEFESVTESMSANLHINCKKS